MVKLLRTSDTQMLNFKKDNHFTSANAQKLHRREVGNNVRVQQEERGY